MRDLKRSEKNVLVVDDKVGGSPIRIYYRQPTTTETLDYNREAYSLEGDGRKRRTLVMNHRAALKAALAVITGWEDGAFGVEGQAISADPAAPNYEPNWKTYLEDTAADILIAVGMQIFGGTNAEAEAPVPFAKS